jgi:hypothetical protein
VGGDHRRSLFHSVEEPAMKTLFNSCLILALTISASAVTAADETQGAADAQAAFAESIKLAPEHAQLKKYVGKWTTETKSYYEDPSKATVSKGTATFRLVMGGRYLQQTIKGEMFGMEFRGRGLTGYDKAKKKYVGTWIDNMSTGISTTQGTYDEKTKTMTEFGVAASPQGEVKLKNVTKEVDKDTIVFTMYMIMPDDSETVGMVITYRRAK